jgi:predicted TIM-barrel fold metal-dependent hydrolase
VSTASADEWLISVDSHLIEPANVWADRLPAKYRDAGPRWVSDEHGESWLFEESKRVPLDSMGSGGAIWPKEDRPPMFTPLTWDQVAPACYDPRARIEAMDRDHELAALCFPNMAGFAGSLFQRASDKDLALACIRAYNDWYLDEWCASYPGRFIGLGIVPLWDGRLAAAEAERVIAKGARALSVSQSPEKIGLPGITDEHWDPLYSVMNQARLPLCMHLGTGIPPAQEDQVADFAEKMREAIKNNDLDNLAQRLGVKKAEAARRRKMLPGTSTSLIGATMGRETLTDWLDSELFQQYPNLTLALSENGVGWIPSVLSLADWTENLNRLAEPSDAPLPSDVFREHIIGCFIDEPITPELVAVVGADNIMIETDFPHTATNWPHSMDRVDVSLQGISAEIRHKILRGNAERAFSFNAAEPPVLAG